jgi:hypothetical protein
MATLVGKRIFIALTGTELPEVLPINRGRPMEGALYTLLGEVTEELAMGIWFKLEKIFDQNLEPMLADFSKGPQYLLPWAAVKRAMLSTDRDPPRLFSGYL